jgi:hypothetical protein
METKLISMLGALRSARGATPLPRRWERARRWWAAQQTRRPALPSLKLILLEERKSRV